MASNSNLFDQNFGVELDTKYLQEQSAISNKRTLLESENNGKSNFRVNVDVIHFKPDEITVKVEDNYIVVEAKHKEQADSHGFISRQFRRGYKLPDYVDKEFIESTLSSDGILTVTGGNKKNGYGSNLLIRRTDEPAIKRMRNGDV